MVTDLDELEAVTREAARDDLDDSDSFSACEVFQQLAIPSVVLELILEVRRSRTSLPSMSPPVFYRGQRVLLVHPEIFRELSMSSYGGIRQMTPADLQEAYIGLARLYSEGMPKKETSPKVSSLASKVLSGSKKPTKAEVRKLAASALSQDETKGRRKKK